jgi:outer membrane protein assembly factor BamB
MSCEMTRQQRRKAALWVVVALILGSPSAVAGEAWISWRNGMENRGMARVGPSVVGEPVKVARIFTGSSPVREDAAWLGSDSSGRPAAVVLTNGRARRFDGQGRTLWTSSPLTLREIIGVDDLDGDGHLEVIASTTGFAANGEIHVISFDSGEEQFSFQFTGGEGGPRRIHSAITSIDGGRTKNLFFVQTYSTSAWAFDFSDGIERGRLLWKSEEMHYNSPQAPPIVADVDGDGRTEVYVDCAGSIYTFDARTGKRLGRAQYSEAPTFGGTFFLAGNGPATRLVRVPASPYSKELAVFDLPQGLADLRWHRLFETGLFTGGVSIKPFGRAHDVDGDGGSEVIVSIVASGSTGEQRRTVSYDIASGEKRWELDDVELVNVVVDHCSPRIIGMTRGATRLALIEPRNGSVPLDEIDGMRAVVQPKRNGLARTMARSTDGMIAEFSVDGAHLVPTALLNDSARGPIRVEASEDGRLALVAEAGGSILVNRSGQVLAPPLHEANLSVPLAADLDSDGRNELLLRVEGGLAAFRSATTNHERLWTRPFAEAGSGNGLDHPVVVVGADGVVEGIVKFETAGPTDGPRILPAPEPTGKRLEFLTPTGEQVWTFSPPAGRWEYLVGFGDFTRDGTQDVFFKDSHEYYGLDGKDGRLLWRGTALSQCQRGVVMRDVNGDGVADVTFKASETLYTISGSDGRPLRSEYEPVAYGGQIALAGDHLAILGAGAAHFPRISSSSAVTEPQQLQTRGVESLAPVVADFDGDRQADVAQIATDGVVRVFGFDGSLINELRVSDRATWPATGVGWDLNAALVFGLPDGTITALQPATSTVLWKVTVPGEAGMPVFADVLPRPGVEMIVYCGDGFVRIFGFDEKVKTNRRLGTDHPEPLRPPQVIVNRNIGEWMLLGYDLDERRAATGEATEVTLHWVIPTNSDVVPGGGLAHVRGSRWVQKLPRLRNLLGDGSFNRPLGVGWRDAYAEDRAEWRFAASSRTGAGGAGFLTTTGRRNSSFTFQTAARPETVYLQSAWLDADGGNVFFGRKWLPADDLSYAVAAWKPERWTRVVDFPISPRGATAVDLWIINFDSSGSVSVDDAILFELGYHVADHCRRGSRGRLSCVSPVAAVEMAR